MKKWWENIRIVEASSIEDYLRRYYKKSRWTDTLIDSYNKEFQRWGYISTSWHDNVTGEHIAWPSHEAIERAQTSPDYPRGG